MKNCSYVCCSPFLHLPAFNFWRGWILPVAVTSAEGSGDTLVPQVLPSVFLPSSNPFCKAKCICWAGFLPSRAPGAHREKSRWLNQCQFSKVLSILKQKTQMSTFLCHPRALPWLSLSPHTAKVILGCRQDSKGQDPHTSFQAPLGSLRHTHAAQLKVAFRSTRWPGSWEALEHTGLSPACALTLSCSDAITWVLG